MLATALNNEEIQSLAVCLSTVSPPTFVVFTLRELTKDVTDIFHVNLYP